ncbi:MAG: hypothetical protein M3Q44_05555 [bacterium]|nr:hypothetical protein [bacterium]
MPETAKNRLDPVTRTLITPYGSTKLRRQEVYYLWALKLAGQVKKHDQAAPFLTRKKADGIPSKNHVAVLVHNLYIDPHHPERPEVLQGLISTDKRSRRLTEPDQLAIRIERYRVDEQADYYAPPGAMLTMNTPFLDLAADTLRWENEEIPINPQIKEALFLMRRRVGVAFTSWQIARAANRFFGTQHSENGIYNRFNNEAKNIPIVSVDYSQSPTTFTLETDLVPVIHIPGHRRINE